MATKNGGKDFWEKLGDSEETLQVKNFVKITLPRTVSGINVFLPFTQKFKMAAKNGGKTIFGKTCQTEDKDKCVFAFYAEIQDGHQKWWERFLGKVRRL